MPFSPPAVSTAEAISFTSQNVQEVNVSAINLLQTQLNSWIARAFVLLDPDNVNQQPIRDWLVPTQVVLKELRPPPLGLPSDDDHKAGLVTFVVWSFMNAVQNAVARAELAPADEAAILAAWNDTWQSPP